MFAALVLRSGMVAGLQPRETVEGHLVKDEKEEEDEKNEKDEENKKDLKDEKD